MASRPRATIKPGTKPPQQTTRFAGSTVIKPGKKGPPVSKVPGPRTPKNPKGKYPTTKTRVVATGPSGKPAGTNTPARVPNVGTGGKPPTVTNPRGGNKPPRTGNKPPRTGNKPPNTGNKPGGGNKPPANTGGPLGIGFNPQKMADTLTDLGYDADLAEIQRQVDMNRGSMDEALKDLQGWTQQISSQAAVDNAAVAEAYKQAYAQSAANDANINSLFGGEAGGEAAAYAGVGEDMLGALQASDARFSANMQQTLAAQGMDYQRRARNEFGQQLSELQGSKRDLLREKNQAYQKNLLELMDMGWQRKQDMLQYQTGQQALKQAQQMAGLEVIQGQQQIQSNNQNLQQGNLNIKAQKLALKKSNLEIKKLQQQSTTGGLDWTNPNTAAQISNAAFTGALSERGTFMINPKVAWENAQMLIGQYGAAGNPRAMAAIWNQFRVLLNLSRAHKRWGQYRIVNNQLVYDPTKKFKTKGK